MHTVNETNAYTMTVDAHDDLLEEIDRMLLDDGYNIIESPMGRKIYSLDEWPDEAPTCRMATIPPAPPSSSSMRVAANVVSATNSADRILDRAARFWTE